MTNLDGLPADFVWGAATAAFQIEGALRDDGRLPSIWDEFCRVPRAIDGGDDGDTACESYRRWPQDFDLLRQLGVDAYRFSVAWPRIQPTGRGAPNEAGLDHYDRMVDDMLAAGIRPFVTLYHWDLPSALQEAGGWASRETALRLADYSGIVVSRLGDRVTEWATVNEPLCIAWLGHLEGRMAPGIRDLRTAVRASYHLLLGHGLTVAAIRAGARADPAIGIVNNLSPCDPASASDEDLVAAVRADGHTNRWWLDPIHGRGFPEDMLAVYGVDLPAVSGDDVPIAAPLDFLGLNYYFPLRVAADPTIATLGYRQVDVPGAKRTSMGWEVYPQGLEDLLVRLTKEYDPAAVYVTENGSAWLDEPGADGYVADCDRTAYLLEHVEAVARAATEGAPVKGYFAWSLLDNFEWSYGYRPRFGLAYVDYPTQRRTLKRSGQTYRDLIRTHRTAAGR